MADFQQVGQLPSRILLRAAVWIGLRSLARASPTVGIQNVTKHRHDIISSVDETVLLADGTLVAIVLTSSTVVVTSRHTRASDGRTPIIEDRAYVVSPPSIAKL